MPPEARRYWTDQMDAAYEFMQRLLAWPVRECGERLCCLRRRAEAAGAEMVFATDLKLGIFERRYEVRESLAEPLLAVGEAVRRCGYVLRVEDGYRPPARQARGACGDYALQSALKWTRWELGGAEPTAELIFRRLAVWTATTPKFANHTSGSAVDVTLLHPDGSPADLGGAYPEMSYVTPMDSPFITPEARRRRRMLRDAFAGQGFVAYPYEFWHFSRGDADAEMIAGTGQPARYGSVHWSDGQDHPIPVADLLEPFLTVDDVRARLASSTG
ncbi:MAG TPA: M15 family metallopeptidase [Phycisphaerae bacterium]|nr:M15 family metallopeptidase [Phycisphaerae bacterium]